MKTKTDTELELWMALRRADKLIQFMSAYIGKMVPGHYGDLYIDLNEHGLFMTRANKS